MPSEEPPRTDRRDASGTTVSHATVWFYWIAPVLAATPLGIAAYVALAEQRPFNWPVAAVFAALGRRYLASRMGNFLLVESPVGASTRRLSRAKIRHPHLRPPTGRVASREPILELARPFYRLALFVALACFTQCDGNSLLLWLARLHLGFDV